MFCCGLDFRAYLTNISKKMINLSSKYLKIQTRPFSNDIIAIVFSTAFLARLFTISFNISIDLIVIDFVARGVVLKIALEAGATFV